MKKQKAVKGRTIFACLADLHCGHRYGSLSPHTVLDALDESEESQCWMPPLTAIQRQLWQWFIEDRDCVVTLAGEDEIILLVLGDIVHGTALGADDLVSPRLSDQYIIATDVLNEYAKLPNLKAIRLVKGTAAHSMRQGSGELIVAKMLRLLSGKDAKAWSLLDLRVRGIYLDLAHKGPSPGSRAWLNGNQVRYYIRSIMDEHLKAGERPPDVVLRGHYHDRRIELVHDHTWKGTLKTWGIIVPAYGSMVDDYTRSITRSKSRMDAGTIAIEVVDSHIKEIHDFTHSIDIHKREILR